MSDQTPTVNSGHSSPVSGVSPGVGAAADDSHGSVMGNIVSDVVTLVRQETELAKEEVKQEASKASRAAAMFSVAGVGAHLAALFLSLALALALAEWFGIDLAWTTLIVGTGWVLIAALLFIRARNRMRTVDPIPHQTIKTLKEGL